MGEKSAIEWTDSSWNPVTGCSKVSPGCAHCYAETLSLKRGWSSVPWTPANAETNVILHPDRLALPLHWRRPHRIFVNSMSDLFHELVPDAFIAAVFQIMAKTPQHTYQVLTKRPERMRAFLKYQEGAEILSRGNSETLDHLTTAELGRLTQRMAGDPTIPTAARLRAGGAGWPLPNVWLGTTVENQRWADERIPLLLDTPATVRFLSVEPMLGPVDLGQWIFPTQDYYGAGGVAWRNRLPSPIQWVICGGESGPDYRPLNLDWARDLRDQCQAAGVAYFFKQVGGKTPKSGGRLLDGRTWDEYPQLAGAAP